MPRTPDAKVLLNALGNVSAEGAALQVFGQAAAVALEALAESSPWDPTPGTLHCTQEEVIAWGLELCALGDQVREARVKLQKAMSAWAVQRAADVKSGAWKHPGVASSNANSDAGAV